MRIGRSTQHASYDLVGRLVRRDVPSTHGTRSIPPAAEPRPIVRQDLDGAVGEAAPHEGAQFTLDIALPGDLPQFEGRRLRPPDSQAGEVSPDPGAVGPH